MKKAIVTLSVILLTAMSAFAGGEKTSNRYLNNKFTQNWFIDASGSLHAWQGSDRSALIDFNTLYYKNAAGDFGRFGGSFRIGKFVSPIVALRLSADMNQATNMYGDFIFESVHTDIMVSLFDLLGGYRNDRIYRMYLFGGFGVAAHADDWFQLTNLNKEFAALAGIQNNFALGKYFDLHLDLQATASKWQIESVAPAFDRRLVHFDFAGGLGLTCYLGGRYFDVCEPCEEVTCPETDCSAQEKEIIILKARIKELEDNSNVAQHCDTIVKFINGESAPFSIFFNIGSYELRDNRDLINLAEIARIAKENGYKMNLRGTCDSATATAEFNQKLAENRCRKIKDELVKLGVNENDIVMQPVGGVAELKPTEYDRRVLITFFK